MSISGTGPYVGQVATRSTIPSALSDPNRAYMARSLHFARQALSTSVQVGFANWYSIAIAGDAAVPATASIRASIEYPAGQFHRLKFSGSRNGTIAPGHTLFSDPVAVQIPNCAAFWIRHHFTNPSGIPYIPVASPLDAMIIDAAGTPDLTMGGTMMPGASVYAAPVAIIAPTTRPSAMLVGDSRLFGAFDRIDDATGDRGDLCRFLGPGYAYIQLGVSGDTLAGFLANSIMRQSLFRYCSFMISEGGVNDIASDAAALLVAELRSKVAALFTHGPVYGTTAYPITTSTDGWATMTNQMVPASGEQLAAFNALVRAGIAGELNHIDISDAVDPGRTRKWSVTGVENGFTEDGLHTNSAGALLIKRSSIWNGVTFGSR